MLSQDFAPASRAGEAQASNEFGERLAHWVSVAAGLLITARAFAEEYLQEQRADARQCLDTRHHAAVLALFEAIKRADREGLEAACAELQAPAAMEPVQLWTVTGEAYQRGSLASVLAENDWLRPGDTVWEVLAAPRARVLVEADFASAAAAPAEIGGAA